MGVVDAPATPSSFWLRSVTGTRVSARVLVETRCRAYDEHAQGVHRPHRVSILPEDEGPMIEQQPTTIDPQPPTTTVVSLTDAAVGKLLELTREETNPAIGLRVYVYSGGCSGFRYGMMLEDAPTPEDQVLEASGIKVYVDGQSISLLQGSEIDYVDTLMGAGFTVNNPNAVAACGCGSSFRTADDGGAPKGCAH
jgi:iron-sulfur cluster assembly accessory protein